MWVNLGYSLLRLHQLVVVSTLGDRRGGREGERDQAAMIATSPTPSVSSPASVASRFGLRAAVFFLSSR